MSRPKRWFIYCWHGAIKDLLGKNRTASIFCKETDEHSTLPKTDEDECIQRALLAVQQWSLANEFGLCQIFFNSIGHCSLFEMMLIRSFIGLGFMVQLICIALNSDVLIMDGRKIRLAERPQYE